MSRVFKAFAALLAIGVLLSGCAGRVIDEVEAKQCTCIDRYCAALRTGYLESANHELLELDQRDAAFFARKGDAACRGELVLPQDPKKRKLHEAPEIEASAYRSQLMRLLANKSNLSNGNSVLLAKAQVSYDCWIQELEEGRQIQDIATCKKTMRESLDAIP